MTSDFGFLLKYGDLSFLADSEKPYFEPATLLSSKDAHTLLCDSTQPFLIGTHVSLHQTIAADGQTLSDELVVADLDRGIVTPCASPASDLFPTSVAVLAGCARQSRESAALA